MTPARAAAALVLLGILGLLWVLARPAKAVPHREVAVVLDLSTSNHPTNLCPELEAILEGSVQSETTLGVRWFVTGTQATGYEPTPLGPWALGVERRMFHPATRPPRPWDGVCTALTPTTDTPLFRAVRAALAEIGRVAGERILVVRSDLLEEEDAVLKSRFRGRTAPPRLDNRGVEVDFCGVTERNLRRGSRVPSAVELEEAWRAELIEPDSARFSSWTSTSPARPWTACGATAG